MSPFIYYFIENKEESFKDIPMIVEALVHTLNKNKFISPDNP